MIKDNIQDIEQRIMAACERSARDRSEVTLIAVSKTKPNEMLEEAFHHGCTHFGENKVQELCKKRDDLDEVFGDRAHWHLIGHLQRNKVKQILGRTELIHSVDSLRLAQAIEDEASKRNLVCDILIEVNISEEESKFGVSEEEVLSFLAALVPMTHLRVRGLMTIAKYTEFPEENRPFFRKMRQLFIDIKDKNIDNDFRGKIDQITEHFNILSMGMTGDFEVAIEEGATMVRVGTGIFGERDYTKPIN